MEIVEDWDGFLWLATYDGVNRLDRNTGKFKRFLHDPADTTSLSYPLCHALFMDAQGVLWFGTGDLFGSASGGGLNRYNPEEENFTRYLHKPKDPHSLIDNRVSAIYEDSKGNFWVGTSIAVLASTAT